MIYLLYRCPDKKTIHIVHGRYDNCFKSEKIVCFSVVLRESLTGRESMVVNYLISLSFLPYTTKIVSMYFNL